MALSDMFKALGEPTRWEILDLLKRGALPAGDIAGHFDMAAATVSHHLAVLRRAGLISGERRGKYIYYALNPAALDEIGGWVRGLCAGRGGA